jgi:hypothetical protein
VLLALERGHKISYMGSDERCLTMSSMKCVPPVRAIAAAVCRLQHRYGIPICHGRLKVDRATVAVYWLCRDPITGETRTEGIGCTGCLDNQLFKCSRAEAL